MRHTTWACIPLRCTTVLAIVCALAVQLPAAEPTITNLNLRGLQSGGTTTLVIDGTELGAADAQLHLPWPCEQQLEKGATATRLTATLKLPADVASGYYSLRVVSPSGVSLPVLVAVDPLPQRPLVGSKVDKLPVALHGTVAGSAVLETQLTLKANETLHLDVEAARLGSKLRPVVHVYDEHRRQLAWAWSTPTLWGDVRLSVKAPKDGSYTIAIHDLEYAAAAPSYFRLKLGNFSSIEQVFPPVVSAGQTTRVELLTSAGLKTVDVKPDAATPFVSLAWPEAALWSGLRPWVQVSSYPELIARGADNAPQDLPAGPVGVSGRLTRPQQEDRFRLPVEPLSKLRLEVFADRYASPLDAAVVVRNEKGEQLARGEDSPGTLDPVLEYTVPAGVQNVIVGVVDAQGRAAPQAMYRLLVEPQSGKQSMVDYRLSTTSGRLTLGASGRAVLPILSERRGYTGPIELSADGLPSHLKLSHVTIPALADGALVTLDRTAGEAATLVTRWRGASAVGARPVLLKNHPLETIQPWLATEVSLLLTKTDSVPFQLDWRDLSADTPLVLGSKLTLPLKISRSDENTLVRLSLVTSQLVSLVNNQPDPIKTLRVEKAVEVAAKTVDTEQPLLVPVELTSPVYDVTVQGELLTADKKTVLATAFAPVRRMPVVNPLGIELAEGLTYTATSDGKAGVNVKVTGKIARRAPLAGDVSLAITGLPSGAVSAAVTVKADQSEFAANIAVPATLAPSEYKGLKLQASIVPDSKLPNQRIKSERELTLLVKRTENDKK